MNLKFYLVRNVTQFWTHQQSVWWLRILTPLLFLFSLLYRAVVSFKRLAYQRGWCKSYRAPVPVIVVGNISVGGTGKTPTVIALVKLLKSLGLKPGVVSRGYGGRTALPRAVTVDSDVNAVGDEAVLIACESQIPVVVAKRRALAVQHLLRQYDCHVVVSDDGLQHYAMQRDFEIALVDSVVGLGNGHCLPLGPLREPAKRLNSVDHMLVKTLRMDCFADARNDGSDARNDGSDARNDGSNARNEGSNARSDGSNARSDGSNARNDRSNARNDESNVHNNIGPVIARRSIATTKQSTSKISNLLISPLSLQKLSNRDPQSVPLNEFKNQYPTVHAVAGIAYPERFFQSLQAAGLEVIAHPYPDHHRMQQSDLLFDDKYPVIMTAKDAVKCSKWDLDHHWVLPVFAEFSHFFQSVIQEWIASQGYFSHYDSS